MNAKLHERMIGDLKLLGYAKRSIGSYVRAVSQLQNFCCKELEEVTEEDLRAYWLYCKDHRSGNRKLSALISSPL